MSSRLDQAVFCPLCGAQALTGLSNLHRQRCGACEASVEVIIHFQGVAPRGN